MDMNHYKTESEKHRSPFIESDWSKGRGVIASAPEIERVPGRWHECWAAFWRVERSWAHCSSGNGRAMAIWSGHMQPFWSSYLHYTFSSQGPVCELCSECFAKSARSAFYLFFMKDVANQSSLIKECLVHFPTFINWRLPIRASE